MKDWDATPINQLKLLLLLLALSNIVTAGFSAYFLKRLDQNYSGLIAQSVPALNRIRALGDSTDEAYRAAQRAGGAPTAERRQANAVQAKELLERCRANIAVSQPFLQSLNWAPADTPLDKLLEQFSADAQTYVKMVVADGQQSPGAADFRRKNLRVSYDALASGIVEAANLIEKRSLEKKDLFTTRTGDHRLVLLGLGGWPLASLAFAAVALAAIVACAIGVTRRMDSANE